MTKLERFDKLVSDFRQLIAKDSNGKDDVYQLFSELIANLSLLVERRPSRFDAFSLEQEFDEVVNTFRVLVRKVYDSRYAETSQLIDQNADRFKLSSFELMEHDFRENTHSNVLSYLFDYRYIGEYGVRSLYFLLDGLEKNSIEGLREKLFSKKYSVEREVHIGNGRVDLLFRDDVNKFLVVVENKILAEVSEKWVNEESNVTETQLDLYQQYFMQHVRYRDYEKMFVLLTFKEKDEPMNNHFEVVGYDRLYQVLMQTDTQDDIARQYLVLLYGLVNNLRDKSWLVERANLISTGVCRFNLSDLEILNLYAYGK